MIAYAETRVHTSHTTCQQPHAFVLAHALCRTPATRTSTPSPGPSAGQWFHASLFLSAGQYVDVQPNDGFGTILPLETLQLDVIFQPTKAKEYSFELVCKSEINR